jgi:hypothetical protein
VVVAVLVGTVHPLAESHLVVVQLLSQFWFWSVEPTQLLLVLVVLVVRLTQGLVAVITRCFIPLQQAVVVGVVQQTTNQVFLVVLVAAVVVMTPHQLEVLEQQIKVTQGQ